MIDSQWRHHINNARRALYQRLVTPKLDDSLVQLQQWYETSLGQQFLDVQTKWVNEHISEMFGYHLMQTGVVASAAFSRHSRIHHQFSVSPLKRCTKVCNKNSIDKSHLQAEPTQLPLADESVDVIIMHHALDFSHDPHQVLKEAQRVIVPSGYIVIMGFNPYSAWGLSQLIQRPFTHNAIHKPQRLRAGRVEDWLSLLSFTPIETQYKSTPLFTAMHTQSSSSKYTDIAKTKSHSLWCKAKAKWLPRLKNNALIDSASLPIGSMYFIVARKDKVAMTPLKPLWQKTRFLGVSAIPSKTGNATAKGHYADILPLRPPSRK